MSHPNSPAPADEHASATTHAKRYAMWAVLWGYRGGKQLAVFAPSRRAALNTLSELCPNTDGMIDESRIQPVWVTAREIEPDAARSTGSASTTQPNQTGGTKS